MPLPHHAFSHALGHRQGAGRLGRGGLPHRHPIAGNEAAEPLSKALGIVHLQRLHRRPGPVQRRPVDLVGIGRQLHVGIAVAQRLVSIEGQHINIVLQQLGTGGRPKAHRDRQAGVHRHAVVRHPWWQVQHVARIQHPVAVRIEMLQQPQRYVIPVSGVRIRAAVDHPAPLPHALHQEHIIVVDMRTHIATPGGKAHHHVVHPPGRQEAEMLQQRPHVSIPLVHVLHQQRPIVVRHAGKLGLVKRPGAQRPLVGGRIMAHQPSQRPLLARQPRQILRKDGRLEIGKRPANQHRPLLPIVTQEALGRHAQRERPFGRIDFQRRQCRLRRLGHRRIILCRNHRKHFILPADMRARVPSGQ